jgi:hypothetical protein
LGIKMGPGIMRRWPIRMAALVVTTACGLARADGPAPDDPLAAARRTFHEGVQAQDARSYAEALDLYSRVRQTAVSPALLFNIATCQERLARLVDAFDNYEQALSLAKERGDDAVAREAAAQIPRVAAAIPHVAVRLPAGARILSAWLDNRSLPLDGLARIPADPGTHRLVVRSDGALLPFDVTFVLSEGAEHPVDVNLPAALTVSPVGPDEARARPRPNYRPAFAAGGVAAAFGIAGLVTGIVGQIDRDRFLSLNAKATDANAAQRQTLHNDGNNLFVAQSVVLGAAAVATGVGLYLYLRPPRDPGPAASVALSSVAPTGSVSACAFVGPRGVELSFAF